MAAGESTSCSKHVQSSSRYGTVAEPVGTRAGRWLRGTARWLETSDDTDPAQFLAWLWFNDFAPRKLRPPILLAWLTLQGLGALFQLDLFFKVSSALAEYEATLDRYCGPAHQLHGICLDASWNLTMDDTLRVATAEGKAFEFSTLTQPATFLIAVEPLAPHETEGWELRTNGPGNCMQEATRNIASQIDRDFRRWFHRDTPPDSSGCDALVATGAGRRYTVLRGLGGWTYPPTPKVWHLNLLLPKQESGSSADVRVFVIDVRAQHLEDIHSQVQCNFLQALQNFNERHNGSHHGILRQTRYYVMLCLSVSVLFILFVLHRFAFYISGDKMMRRIVVLKLFLQDLPQQVCIVSFLYSWYAINGLRCQMCLFHAEHCGDWDPLSTDNLLLCFFTVLSASANQLLIRGRSNLDLFDNMFLYMFRAMLFGLSTLPLSIAFYLSALWFHYPSRTTLIAACVGGAVPTVLGILAILWTPLLFFFRTPYGAPMLDALDKWIESKFES